MSGLVRRNVPPRLVKTPLRLDSNSGKGSTHCGPFSEVKRFGVKGVDGLVLIVRS